MKDVALSSVARILVIVFQLINVKLYTHYLSAEQLGMFFFLLTVSYSANALLFVPVDYYQQAKLAEIMKAGGAQSLLKFNGKLVALYLCFSWVSVMTCVLIKPDYAVHAVLVVVLALALYVVQALRNTLNNLEYRSFVSISFIQEAIIKVLLIYVLFQYVEADESLLIVAGIISLVVTGGYLFYCTHKKGVFLGACVQKISAKEVYYFAYPFSIGAVCNWLQLQGYRLVLIPLGFAEEVGIFTTLSSIGGAAISAASLIYSQQFTPLIYKSSGQYTAKYLKGAVAVIISVALVSFGMGEFIVKVLTNSHFAQHWKLLLFGVITDGGNLIIGALAIYITLTGSTKKIISFSLIGLLAMVVSFSVLYVASKISVVTIGIPLLISQWLAALSMYLVFRINSSQKLSK